MTKEELKQEFKKLTDEMRYIVDQLGQPAEDPLFTRDYDITNPNQDVLAQSTDEVEPLDEPGKPGYAKFVPDDKLHAAWLRVSIQLIQRIANPHLSKDGVKDVVNGIRLLLDLHLEKLGVKQ